MRIPALLLLMSMAPLLVEAKAPRRIVREYRVSPSFVEWFSLGRTADLESQGSDVLTATGVAYPRSSSIYLPSSNKLVVYDSKEFHRLIRRLIAQWEKARFRGEGPDPAILKALNEAHLKSSGEQ